MKTKSKNDRCKARLGREVQRELGRSLGATVGRFGPVIFNESGAIGGPDGLRWFGVGIQASHSPKARALRLLLIGSQFSPCGFLWDAARMFSLGAVCALTNA